MTRCVFIHRTNSIYDDVPSERYQFPSQYLSRIKQSVGDWIIYYEPKKVRDTRGYFAVAKVQEIIPDPGISDMFIAIIEPGSYLEFGSPVSFKGEDGLIERGLLNSAGNISGRAQAAVRPVSDGDFSRIVDLGLLSTDPILPRTDDFDPSVGFEEEQAPFEHFQATDRARYFGSRVLRDRNFRRIVLNAYNGRCSLSGLKLINGGGRLEVQAAHIRPVEEDGPDLMSNGLALTGTAHWMFDRGLVTVEDDLKIIVSRQVNDRDAVDSMINNSGFLLPPKRASDRPHPRFLEWHREHRFKH